MHRHILIFFSFLLFFLTGCEEKAKDSPTAQNPLEMEWEALQTSVKESTVTIHMWGGSDAVNRYMDEYVAPALKERYGLTLKRIPITDIRDVINRLMVEKELKKQSGTADLLWINGENFKTAKTKGLLWAPFSHKLPNYTRYVNPGNPSVTHDFREPVEGLESPWGMAQFVFIYDSRHIDTPPHSMDELMTFARAYPGKFTYPAPPDFTGSAFVRQVMIEKSQNYDAYLNSTDKTLVESDTQPFELLKSLKPYLWREGNTYPESSAKLDQLYKNGEVWFTMSYNPAQAVNYMKSGFFPETTKTYIMQAGSLSNTHFLSIPFNSPNKAGAMVVADFLLSPEAQIKKLDPAVWGDGMVLDSSRFSGKERELFESLKAQYDTIPYEALSQNPVSEVYSDHVDPIERSWQKHIAKP